jgi:hypothetical protein
MYGVEGVGTFVTAEYTVRVAKASSGHFPLPFLISILKNWTAKIYTVV